MEQKRNYVIMMLIGVYIAKYPDESGADTILRVDNHLLANNNPPLTFDEKKLVNELYDELWLMMKIDGYNRNSLRKIGNKKKNEL